MRFLMMVKSAENAGPPPDELMEAIAKLSQGGLQSGKMIQTGGLAPTSASTRVRISGGSLNVMDGPFTETKEVVGGYAIMEFASRAEAVESAKQFMDLHRKYWPGWEGETEIRQMFTAEDYQSQCGKFQLKAGAVSER